VDTPTPRPEHPPGRSGSAQFGNVFIRQDVNVVSEKYPDINLCAILPLPGISASLKRLAEGLKANDAFSGCDWREGAVFSRFIYGGNPWP
jgi:hypothetical protein